MSSNSSLTPQRRQEEKRMEDFILFMQRLDVTVVGDEEVSHVRQVAEHHIEPIRIIDDPPTSDELMNEDFREKLMGPIFPSADEGLKSNGWSEFGHRALGSGSFGSVHLGFRSRHLNRKFEERLLCAIKVINSAENDEETWEAVADEIAFMRCLSHPHVVGYYCNFRVQEPAGRQELSPSFKKEASSSRLQPSTRSTFDQLLESYDQRKARKQSGGSGRSRSPSPQGATGGSHTPRYRTLPKGPEKMYILMEFANAGNMRNEIFRYPNHRIPETGARYYGLQLVEALVYIHSRHIMHNDIHPKNVLLKFNPDGRTKKAMLCDFGRSYLIEDPDESVALDVEKVFNVIRTMLIGYRNTPSDAVLLKQGYNDTAIQFVKRWSHDWSKQMDPNTTAQQLLDDKWFRLGAVAPVPLHADAPDAVPHVHYVDQPIHPAHFRAQVPMTRAVRSAAPSLPSLGESGVPAPGDPFYTPITPGRGRVIQAAGLRAQLPVEKYPYERRQVLDPRDAAAEGTVPVVQRRVRTASGQEAVVAEAVRPDSSSSGSGRGRQSRGTSGGSQESLPGPGRGWKPRSYSR